MFKSRKNELSLYMRIPAEMRYLDNVLLTLEEICEHFMVNSHSRDRIKKALAFVLAKFIDHLHHKFSGLFDLKFSICDEKFQIIVKNLMLADNHELMTLESPLTQDKLREMLINVISLTDDFKIISETVQHTFLMQFNLLPSKS